MGVETEHFKLKLLGRFSDLNTKNEYLPVGDQERRANNVAGLFDSLASTGKLEIRRAKSGELQGEKYLVSQLDQNQVLILDIRLAGKLSILDEELWAGVARMTPEDDKAIVQAFLEIYANILSD